MLPPPHADAEPMESDYTDIGLVVGTGVFMLFGLIIAFGLPKAFAKDEGLSEENLRFLSWIKWLGLTLCFISLLVAASIIFLP